jgi:hypothetical protein
MEPLLSLVRMRGIWTAELSVVRMAEMAARVEPAVLVEMSARVESAA